MHKLESNLTAWQPSKAPIWSIAHSCHYEVEG